MSSSYPIFTRAQWILLNVDTRILEYAKPYIAMQPNIRWAFILRFINGTGPTIRKEINIVMLPIIDSKEADLDLSHICKGNI